MCHIHPRKLCSLRPEPESSATRDDREIWRASGRRIPFKRSVSNTDSTVTNAVQLVMIGSMACIWEEDPRGQNLGLTVLHMPYSRPESGLDYLMSATFRARSLPLLSDRCHIHPRKLCSLRPEPESSATRDDREYGVHLGGGLCGSFFRRRR